MAKITIAGEAVIITSALKLEDIKKVQKYRPKELVLKGGEDGKEPIFRIAATSGSGDICAVGAEFGAESRDERKLATITMFMPGCNADNIKEFVADKLGAAMVNLKKLEDKLPAVLAEIDAEKAEIMANITIAQ